MSNDEFQSPIEVKFPNTADTGRWPWVDIDEYTFGFMPGKNVKLFDPLLIVASPLPETKLCTGREPAANENTFTDSLRSSKNPPPRPGST